MSDDSLWRLHRGFERLAMLIAPTLGPMGGAVLHAAHGRRTEHLTDAGTIARRMMDVRDPAENTGAMLLRTLVLAMHERYGDGGATATVLARAMLAEAIRAVTVGAHPTLVRQGIERSAASAVQSLDAQARPARGEALLTRMATGVTADPELGEVLGEMFDLLGEHGAFHIEESPTPGIDREYLDGGRWRARPAARDLMPGDGARLVLNQPLVLVAADAAITAAQLVPVLEAARAMPDSPLLLVTGAGIEKEALATLLLNANRGTVTVGAMVLASSKPAIPDDLADLALFTGATIVAEERGRPWQRSGMAHLGRARTAILSRSHLVVTGGAGDRAQIQAGLADLRARSARADASRDERERLARRMARLAGGAGVLRVGGRTERERKVRKEQAERASRMFALALTGGVVPGGGGAYLGCVDAAWATHQAIVDRDEAAGAAAVARALEAPFLQIVENRGLLHPPLALDRVRSLGPDHGYDAVTGAFVHLAEAGMVDCLGVARGALEAAASTVATAITTGAIVDRQPGGRVR